MKIQKFKLERKILQESLTTINSLRIRIRIIMGCVINDNPSDSYAFDTLNLYLNYLKEYSRELEKILTMPGHIFLVPSQTMDRLNTYKKEADLTEKIFSRISTYSLRVH